MRAVIIGNGEIRDYTYIRGKIKDSDFIICADGGFGHAIEMGIEPDVVIGDFDSCDICKTPAKVLKYPTRKDFTDGELAVTYAAENGYDDIILIAMTGDRADHTIADILLLDKCKNGILIDDNNEIYLLRDKLSISGKKGQTLSIVPINGDTEGVVTQGLEYPLSGETLYFGSSRGISNVMTRERCEISIERGRALVIKVENV